MGVDMGGKFSAARPRVRIRTNEDRVAWRALTLRGTTLALTVAVIVTATHMAVGSVAPPPLRQWLHRAASSTSPTAPPSPMDR